MRVLVPLPDRDFDPTEVAVPWRGLTDAGHELIFATERGGLPPTCDPRLLTGVLFGRLGAQADAIAAYGEMTEAPEFRAPIPWAQVVATDFDGLILPGGHAPGMRQYLGSPALREKSPVSGHFGGPSARSATVCSSSPAQPRVPRAEV